ncbi:hypothetical protein N2152v2_011210 [Parachlorella kessleri]
MLGLDQPNPPPLRKIPSRKAVEVAFSGHNIQLWVRNKEEYDMQESWVNDEKSMAGDVNLFWNDYDDPSVAEIMVMVAEPRSRRKGIAEEAVLLLMSYAAAHLGVARFRAKISDSNEPSLALFGKLGYSHKNRSAVFKEITLELGQGDEAWQELGKQADLLQLDVYDGSDASVGAGPGSAAGLDTLGVIPA